MYPVALREMTNGRKQSHWMWFIFPQLRELGRSHTALYYGIENIHEAKAYLAHPVLGARLREISAVLLTLDASDPLALMGFPDNRKLCSCMTLFSKAAEDNQVFLDVLQKFFGGVADSRTIEILERNELSGN